VKGTITISKTGATTWGVLLGIALCARVALAQKPAHTGCAICFENHQPGSDVNFVLENGTVPDKPIIDGIPGGLALLDYDNDGYLDIFFTNGASIPGLRKDGPQFSNRLYRNNHDGTFTDVTEKAGVGGVGYSIGVAAADYDNDGWTDLYVMGVNRNALYRNNHNGTFTDVTKKAGVTGIDKSGKKLLSVAAAWIDYDNDGHLDLFVSNYLDWTPENSRVCGPVGRRISCPPSLYKGEPNLLYHNNGDGTFTDVSDQTGIGKHVGKGMSVAIADYDGDGWMDIFVANDNEPNFLFRNNQGKSFEELGVEAGVAYTEDGIPVSSMGVAFADYRNEGKPGIFVTALGGETFPLFRNIGNGLFNSDTYPADLGVPSFKLSGWGVGMYDFDNDGYKDIFTANSHVSENADIDPLQHYRQPNAVFRNQHDGTFVDQSIEAGLATATAAHRGAAFGDLNNDGKIDVVVSAIGSPAELLYNTGGAGNHWILIRTIGTRSNRDGIGTQIKITVPSGAVQYGEVSPAGSYASSSDKRVHFGLGAEKTIKEIELHWPSGAVQVLRNIEADQIITVTEGAR
jgi:hypothetical protein